MDLTHDVRYALRTIRKRPGFAVVAVLALALGIGANSAVFSVVNAVLLRPLAFAELDRLVEIRDSGLNRSGTGSSVTPADYLDWKARAMSFDRMAAYSYANFQIGSDGADPAGVYAARITTDLLTTLGTKPAHGRDFGPDEEDVAFISDSLWRDRFAADPAVLGRTILVDRKPHIIVGIMPGNFDFPLPRTSLWTSLTLSAADRANRTRSSLYVVGHLKEGVSRQAAAAEMDTQARRLAKEHPDTNANRKTKLVLLRERQIEFSAPYLALLQAAAAFVLLIGCANLANLQMAHGVARSQELAVRATLGAGRWRMARLLLIESLVLALIGGLAGVWVAYAGVELIKSSVPAETARAVVGWSQIALHPPVLLFTSVIAIVAGLIFGVSAAWRASRIQLTESLKDGSAQGGSKSRLRPILVVAEVMLAVVAVIGATQVARGFQAMFDVYGGFSPDRILAVRLTLPRDSYDSPQKITRFLDQAMHGAASIPAVEVAAVTSNLPGALAFNAPSRMDVEGRPALRASDVLTADFQLIGPEYFRTLSIPVQAGRTFGEQDGEETPLVAVVDQRFAARFWPGENPIGKRVALDVAKPGVWRTVVGVVADVQQLWFQQDPRPLVYLPYRQSPPRNLFLALRTHGDPMAVLPALRERIAKLDAALPLYEPRAMRQVMQETMSAMRLATGMMMIFGILALVLAAIGVYGVMAYSVTQRHREFGIRMALGARPAAVLRMVMRQGLILAGIGCVLGLGSGIAVSRAMGGIMYGVGTQNVAVLLGAPILLAVISLAAAWIPARTVMRVNPAAVLRRD